MSKEAQPILNYITVPDVGFIPWVLAQGYSYNRDCSREDNFLTFSKERQAELLSKYDKESREKALAFSRAANYG